METWETFTKAERSIESYEDEIYELKDDVENLQEENKLLKHGCKVLIGVSILMTILFIVSNL